MAEIIPAVMPKTLRDLEEHVARVVEIVDTIQVDIMDGGFVREKTWPYIKHDDYFDAIMRGEEGLPFWKTIDYEIDLMVNDPVEAAEQWMQAGARRLLFHIESLNTFKQKKDIAEDMEKILALRSEFIEVGLSIGVETPVEVIKPYLHEIVCVQCMGIKRIGYQHEPLDERVLEKIREIRALAPDLEISVDGGVNHDTIRELAEAGATRFVSGSAVFESTNPVEAVYLLKQEGEV